MKKNILKNDDAYIPIIMFLKPKEIPYFIIVVGAIILLSPLLNLVPGIKSSDWQVLIGAVVLGMAIISLGIALKIYQSRITLKNPTIKPYKKELKTCPCPECGHMILINSMECPRCGRQLRN